MPTSTGERRRQNRLGNCFPQGLTIAYPGQRRMIPSKFIDAGEGGLGVKMLAPLAIGALVSVAGELHGDYCLGLRGSARVAHCLCTEQGTFRIGLSFEKISYWGLHCQHDARALESETPAELVFED